MKRSYYVIGILTVIIIMSSLLYYRYFSETYVLKRENFSKGNIVIKEEYPMFDDESASAFLLANSEQIGLIFSVKNKYGIWRSGLSSIAKEPLDEQLVTVGFAISLDESMDIESHIMVAYYVDRQFEVESPPEYDLTVEFIPINDRLLLFAHAVGNSLSSVEIVSYLETYYK